jgi:hypothetical protein
MAFGDTVPDDLPRWSSTTGGTLSNTSEPVSQRKDVGIQSTDNGVTYQWLNWLFATIYTWLNYWKATFEDIFDENFVARNGVVANAEVTETSPASMAVAVAAGKVWIQGSFYAIDAGNVVIAPADATNDRYDVVVADVTSGVATYTKVTGTPAASPTVPSIAANQARLANILVPAATVTVITSRITDKRRKGAITVGALKANDTAQLGDMGGGSYLLAVDAETETATFAGAMTELSADDTQIGPETKVVKFGEVSAGNWGIRAPGDGRIVYDEDAAEWKNAVVKRVNIAPGAAFKTGSVVQSGGSAQTPAGANGGITAPVILPDGAEIVALRCYAERPSGFNDLTVTLYRSNLSTGASGTIATDTTSSGTGSITLEDLTPTNGTVANSTYCYFVIVNANNATGAADLLVHGIEVEYTVAEVAHS